MQNSFLVGLYLFLMALLPAGLSVGIYFLQKYTKFRYVNYWYQQIIIGVIFGGVAIFGTHVGVDVGGAVANIRDTGPLCAGLIFGGPAGIIAGVIGGLERFCMAYVNWSKFGYTQIACSVATVFAGVYAFLLRKYMFEDKRPSWGFGLAIGMVMEVVHMTIVFLTHMDDLEKSFNIIKILSIPMIFTCGLAVMMPCLTLELISKKRHKNRKKSKYKKLTNRIQGWMLASVGVIFALTMLFTYFAQSNSAFKSCDTNLNQSITDVVNDVKQSTENDIEKVCLKVDTQIEEWMENKTVITRDMLQALANKEGIKVNEINIIENKLNSFHPERGVIPHITLSTVPEFDGYVMEDNEQSKPFNILLDSAENHKTFFVQEARENSKKTIMKYAGSTIDKTKNNNIETYIQVAYNYETYSIVINNKVKNLSEVRHVGTSGKIIVADKDEIIVSEKQSEGLGTFRSLEDLGFDSSLNERTRYQKVLQLNFGVNPVECYYSYARAEFYYVVSTITTTEVVAGRDNMIYFTSFMEVIVLAILFAIIYKLLMKLVVDNLTTVNKDLAKIIGGDLNVKLNVKGSEEFASLSDDINSTVTTLKKYIEEAKHRIDEELKFAKSIQLSTLPTGNNAFPDIKEINVNAKMYTAKEVGGDFYDYYLLDGNRVGFLIADVSGKGIPAAMFMMQSKATIKNYATHNKSTSDIITFANQELCKENDAGMFVTCWFGIVELDTGLIKFTNAGHNPPLVYKKATNSWEYLKSKAGFVLGGLDISVYHECELKLEAGDKLFLYTDGVTEATRKDKVLYGEDRLINYLNKSKEEDNNKVLEKLKKSIDTFIDGAPQFDDITMLLLEYKGKEKDKFIK